MVYGRSRPIARWVNSFTESMKKKENNRADLSTAIIADLSRAIEDLESRRKKPEELEGIIDEAKTLAGQWKNPYSAKDPKYRLPLFDSTSSGRSFLLAALVVALKREVEVLERIRRHFPNELEKLNRDSRDADDVAALLAWGQAHPKQKREGKPTKEGKPTREDKRSKWDRHFYNSIEYQFGGGLEAEFRKRLPLLALGPFDPTYQPVCLDKIFAGDSVNMDALEDLFVGIGRKRLGKLLRRKVKKKRQYDWSDVIQIMGKLLKETHEFLRKEETPEAQEPVLGPPRKVWLYDRKNPNPDLCERVISGIEVWIKSLSVPEQIKPRIKAKFLEVIRRYRLDSGIK